MTRLVRPDGRWRVGTVLGVLLPVIAGVVLVGAAYRTAPVPAVPAAPAGSPLPAARPVRIDIDAIGVHAAIEPVGVDRAGAVQAPPLDRPEIAGWYRLGPVPGEPGNAVVLGHLDTVDAGPAVFHRLARLAAGAETRVTRADRSVAVFRVERVTLHAKEAFPAALVYGPTDRAQLRLVTCGGTYARGGGYLANTVVTATLA